MDMVALNQKTIAAAGLLLVAGGAAVYAIVKKPGKGFVGSFADMTAGAALDALTGVYDAVVDRVKDTDIYYNLTYDNPMTFTEMLYYDGLWHDATWQGEERSMINSALNGLTWGAWKKGWFGWFD
jgi:hypothetical protein